MISLGRWYQGFALDHAADVHHDYVRLHAVPLRREFVDVPMAVAEVVNHPHAGDAVSLQPFDYGDLVIRMPEPVVVVVQLYGATVRLRQFDDPADPFGLPIDALRLLLGCLDLRSAAHHPKLRMNAVPFTNFQYRSGDRVIRIRWEPPRRDLDAMPFHRVYFGVEGRYVLFAPVVRKILEPEPLQHGRPLLRPALVCVEGYHAPRSQILATKKVRRGRGGVRSLQRIASVRRRQQDTYREKGKFFVDFLHVARQFSNRFLVGTPATFRRMRYSPVLAVM